MDAEELTGSLKKLVMWYKVKELKSKGLNKTQIARCLGINRNTVRISVDEWERVYEQPELSS